MMKKNQKINQKRNIENIVVVKKNKKMNLNSSLNY